jgi:hypothetical protein
VGAQDAYLSITISPDKTWARSVISDPFWLLKARLGVIARLKPFVSVWAATSDWGVDEKKRKKWGDGSTASTKGILPKGLGFAHQIGG